MSRPRMFSRRGFLGAGAAIGAATLLATPGSARADDVAIAPIDWGALGSYGGTDDTGQRLTAILAGSSRYLIGPWYAATYTRYLPDGYLDLKGTDERAIRLPGMAAVAAATALVTNTYDPRSLSAANATIRTRNLIRTLAARHRATNLDPATRWGGTWQSALWAYYTALAGWLFADQLDAGTHGHLAAMLAWEADRLTTGNDVYLLGTGGDQLYMTRRDGTVVTPGDSKAEEASWSAAALSLAAVMLPGHPGVARWTRRNVELLLAAAARPGDLTGTAMKNGIRLSSWLQGTNIADDGTLQNHARLHPLYMVSFDQSLYQGFVYGLADRPAPRAALHNITRIYRALVDNRFPLPGGGYSPIYRPGSAEIYYPEGNDWGTHFPFYFGSFDLLVSLIGEDGTVNPPAFVWEQRHNDAQLALMARFTDGRTYGANGENTYYGREHRIGVMAAQTYLTLFLARNTTGNRLRWE